MKTEHREVLLKEWEERYESYRQYRGQYLTVMSIMLTGGLFGSGFFLSQATDNTFRLLIVIGVCLLVLVLIIAHYIAIKSIRRLGERIRFLQKGTRDGSIRNHMAIGSSAESNIDRFLAC